MSEIDFFLRLVILGIVGTTLTGCSDGAAHGEPSIAFEKVENAETFVREYLSTRFNRSDLSSLGAPRKGFLIPVKLRENGLEAANLEIPKLIKTTQYAVRPFGGPFEFPNVIVSDGASPAGLQALQTFSIGRLNETSTAWTIGHDDVFDLGTYINGSLEKDASICPSGSEAYSAKISFSSKIDQTKRTADIAVCVSNVKVEGGVSAEKMPYIQTVITGIRGS